MYNRFLALRKELYDTEKKTLNYNGCSQQLTLLKKEIEWLKEVDKFALQNSLKNLDTAYKNFFADLKKDIGKKNVGFPKFKKKYGCKQSYKTNLTNGNIQVLQNRLKPHVARSVGGGSFPHRTSYRMDKVSQVSRNYWLPSKRHYYPHNALESTLPVFYVRRRLISIPRPLKILD